MIEFERAQRDEASKLRNFVQTACGQELALYENTAPVCGDAADFEADIASRRLWKITDDGELIGVINIHVAADHTGCLDYLCIAENHRNRGVGTKAVSWAEENYRVENWQAEIPRSSAAAAGFLNKNGFRSDTSDSPAAIFRKSMLETKSVPDGGNIFDGIGAAGWDEEYFETLKQIPGLMIERIVSRGQTSPDEGFYDQDWTEIVFIVQGTARLEIEGVIHSLHTGDWRCLLPHVRHRVVYTSKDPACIWLAVHQK